ncbi:unnamed protein product [Acidithrix sp. C25]|nr:unnamed protein product [Acidithrix sp. C25]
MYTFFVAASLVFSTAFGIAKELNTYQPDRFGSLIKRQPP